MSTNSSAEMLRQISNGNARYSSWKGIYLMGGVAAVLALAANLLDVMLGFGDTTITAYGAKSAVEWFMLFEDDWFKGLYMLGILNIVYMTCMVPVYFAIFISHRHTHWIYAALAMSVYFISTAIYLSNNAAIPMFVLASRYATVETEAQRAMFAAAGEAVLARGEDFTPGAFIGLIFSGIAAITISFVMLRGGIFGKTTAWVGMIGFTFLSIFIIWATFVTVLYDIAFYLFGMIGGLLALVWFALVAIRCFKLGRTEYEESELTYENSY